MEKGQPDESRRKTDEWHSGETFCFRLNTIQITHFVSSHVFSTHPHCTRTPNVFLYGGNVFVWSECILFIHLMFVWAQNCIYLPLFLCKHIFAHSQNSTSVMYLLWWSYTPYIAGGRFVAGTIWIEKNERHSTIFIVSFALNACRTHRFYGNLYKYNIYHMYMYICGHTGKWAIFIDALRGW